MKRQSLDFDANKCVAIYNVHRNLPINCDLNNIHLKKTIAEKGLDLAPDHVITSSRDANVAEAQHNQLAGAIKRNFPEIDQHTCHTLCFAIVKPHFEYDG